MVPIMSTTKDGALRADHVVMAKDESAALDYALALLLATNREFAKGLCLCGECKRFFLAQRPNSKNGCTRRKYCSQEHLEAFHNNRAKERVKASRARKKALKLNRAQSRRRQAAN
jgi:hypothetical protein